MIVSYPKPPDCADCGATLSQLDAELFLRGASTRPLCWECGKKHKVPGAHAEIVYGEKGSR